MTPPPPAAAPRLQSLDILRGAAVLLVLFRHIGYDGVPHDLPGWIGGPLRLLERMGWAGVDLFFVLSGFLVSSLLFRDYQRHGKIDWKSFLIRRGFKIYPPFYVLMAVTVVVVLKGHYAVSARQAAGELFFLQNYLGYFWNHTWTLAVEEHFYLILPAVLLVCAARGGKRPFHALPACLVGLFVVVLGLRLGTQALAAGKPFDTVRSVLPTHLRIDSLAFGVLLSYLHHFRAEALGRFFLRVRYFLPAVALLCYLPAMLFEIEHTPFLYTWGFTLLYVGNGALLLLALHAAPRGDVISRAVSFVGVHSYSIYLWHIFVILSVVPRLRPFLPASHGAAWALLGYLALSVAIGIAMGKLVEGPALRLRDRLFPSPASALPR